MYSPPVPAIIEEAHDAEFAEWEQYVSKGMEAREKKDTAQWELGEIAYEVSQKFYKRKEIYGLNIIGEFANEIGVHKKTLERYRRVYKTFSDKNTILDTNLSFSHYERCSRTENPTEWIEKAVDNNWSVDKLSYEIQKDGGNIKEPKEIQCPHCNKMFTLE